ncbi:polygalacturonase QRT3-like [Telopea speciosissima]|uniref:polygalacturonase QRT3-like n=1 Tax=Telopea speciosissima TaxID=54955 RepID=UPI001CC55DBA|nr:polygalacturonase QRT3-like [Telopea speciosissima]
MNHMKATMARKAVVIFIKVVWLASLIVFHAYGETAKMGSFPVTQSPYCDKIKQMQGLKVSLFRRDLLSISPISVSPSPSYNPTMLSKSRIYRVTDYGADPSGKSDSTDALLKAISDAFQPPSDRILMQGISDLGGAEVFFEGGSYMISRPLQLPSTGGGNLLIHGGSLQASNDFLVDRYLIELSTSSAAEEKHEKHNSMEEKLSSSTYSYEYITLKDLLFDSNYRGGGISVINSLRTTIDNCYITHFTSNGVLVKGGHETYIRNSFLGQHITAGGDPGERNFSGTAISLMGNDNAVTDVVIFSAATGILVSGQANTLSGIHCYNKATGFGGTGIYLQLPGLTQTRIVNSYMDYTGIVAEDPVQLHVSNSFFLGDAFVLFKSIKGVVRGVNIVDNMFSGSGTGVDIVQLDQSNGPFTTIDQVVIDRNNVNGMTLRATVARGLKQGNGSSWDIDFNQVLLFPNLIKSVLYTLSTSDSFPNHSLRNVSGNHVVVESDASVTASIYVMVDQSPVSTG